MEFKPVIITEIAKNATSGIITFSGEISQTPSRTGIIFSCRPTDFIQISSDRATIQVWNGYSGIQFGVNPTMTVAGDPSSPYTYTNEDASAWDYQDKLDSIYSYLVSDMMAGCCCPEITIVGSTVFVDTEADLPATGTENILYVAKDQGTEFRWDGAAYRQLVVEDSAITVYNSRVFR